MAAAVPFAIKAGTMLGGALLGKKTSGASKQQQQAQQGTAQSAQMLMNAAGPLMRTGYNMMGQGQQSLGQAGSYYSNILSNRRAASESLAPEMKTAMDYYTGAGKKVQRTMRGGARDYAQAELDREKVGNMAMMLPAARARAAEGATGVGGTMLDAGTALTAQGGNLYSNAAGVNNQMFQQAGTIRNQEAEGGKAWGGILYDAAQMIPWGKKPSLPSSSIPATPSPPPALPGNQGASAGVYDYYGYGGR